MMKFAHHIKTPGVLEEIAQRCYLRARSEQKGWGALPPRERMRRIGRVAGIIADSASELAAVASADQDRIAETLISQILPLADACKFLARSGAHILAPRRLGRRGRPAWLFGVHSEILREPFGVVLIIAPANYPLLLPGVQVLQALAAGNAVLLKPAEGCAEAARALVTILAKAGINPALVNILPDTAEAARVALTRPVDKVFFTGSFETGTSLLAALAIRAVPVVAELSGCDAVFVRADADVSLAMRALLFGLRLNKGATCIAPRRVFVARRLAERLEAELHTALSAETPMRADPKQTAQLAPILADAVAEGATILAGGFDALGEFMLPCVISGARPAMRIMRMDIFAPVLCIVPVDSDDEALALAAECPFALGASIFSEDVNAARALAARTRAGIVTINDLVVPTADPRVPFGGRGQSGYGITRGAEGLLEMTAPKVIQHRRGKFRPHFDPPRAGDETLFREWIAVAHGSSFLRRIAALWRLLRAATRRGF